MRTTFATCLTEAAKSDERIILLIGDHGYSLFDQFRRTCPQQYINAGVAEQNMIGVAAGLAKLGFKPVVYGLSAFIPIRVLEQIKLDICYQQLPVILIGDGAGVVYSTLGSSHQSTEDIASLRAVPNISILSPADSQEMKQCMHLALTADCPVYLRMGKDDLGDVHTSLPNFGWGDLCHIQSGAGEIGFIATGSMVKTALEVSRKFDNSSVWSAPSLKPVDTKQVIAICDQHQTVVSLEEHSIYGGLGSIVAEIAADHSPTWVCRVGIQDRFSQFCGSYTYLMKEHKLDVDSVINQIQCFLTKRISDKKQLTLPQFSVDD
jgi:transketolase